MFESDVDALLADAMTLPFRGWDFSVVGDRIVLEPPPWKFEEIVDTEAQRADSILDLGTGGGEWLSRRRHATRTVATESWEPNVALAATTLKPFGVSVTQTEAAAENVEQLMHPARGRLPFRSAVFDLVLSRHEAFTASEVHRVLRPGGLFLTQQASSGTQEFHRLLGLDPPVDTEFHLHLALEQLQSAGLRVEHAAVGTATTTFGDIGALAWYLTNVPWAVPGFSIEQHRGALIALHGQPIPVRSERFWLRAVR